MSHGAIRRPPERADVARRYVGMAPTRSRRNISVAVLTLGHAGVAGLLGLAASGLVLSGATGGCEFLVGSIRDSAVTLVLALTAASLLAAGSGISAFILLNVERTEAPQASDDLRFNRRSDSCR